MTHLQNKQVCDADKVLVVLSMLCFKTFIATTIDLNVPISQTDKKKSSSGKKSPEHSNMAADLPLIAIMAATTTRKINKPSTKNLSLFMFLLTSLIRTLDCGFRYEYVLGYDKGDPYYDSKEVSE